MYLAFITGLVSSLHCLGMCGPIALALPVQNMGRVGIYNLGRISTYVVLGAVFGFFGKGLSLMGLQQNLSIVLGLLILIVAFLPMVRPAWVNTGTVYLRKWFVPFFQKKNLTALFMIGVLNGLLPCGMVYLALMGAISMAHPLDGALYMSLFGLGTLPMMVTVSLSKRMFTPSFRLHLNKLLPVFAVCVGLLLIVRGLNLGIAYISPHTEKETMSCCKKPQ